MKKIFFIAFAALTLAACDNNEDNPETSQVAARITASIGERTSTRASDTDWAEGDEIGILSRIGTEEPGVQGPYVNLKYKFIDTTEEGYGEFNGTKIFFYNSMSLIAYYPFTGSENTVPGDNGVIEANTGAENQTSDKQPEIDFLWDSKTGVGKKDFSAKDPNVQFTFSHKMSKVTFTFLDSPEIKDEDGIVLAGPVHVSDMVKYSIKGLALEGTFNTYNGVCAVNNVEKTDLTIDVNNVIDNEPVNPVEDNKPVNPLILFPQTLNDGKAELHIDTDELKKNNPESYQHYKCNLSFSNGVILPGYHYKYTIKVSKIGLIVGKMTVEPWVEKKHYTTATIDGEEAFNKKDNS